MTDENEELFDRESDFANTLQELDDKIDRRTNALRESIYVGAMHENDSDDDQFTMPSMTINESSETFIVLQNPQMKPNRYQEQKKLEQLAPSQLPKPTRPKSSKSIQYTKAIKIFEQHGLDKHQGMSNALAKKSLADYCINELKMAQGQKDEVVEQIMAVVETDKDVKIKQLEDCLRFAEVMQSQLEDTEVQQTKRPQASTNAIISRAREVF